LGYYRIQNSYFEETGSAYFKKGYTRIMKKILISFLILFFTAVIAYGSDLPFSIKIKVDEKSLVAFSDPKKNEDSFTILTEITNISGKAQDLEVFSCCYADSWVSDNLAVAAICKCSQNFPKNILLEAGKSFGRPLTVGLFKEAVPGSVTFKLGFKQFASMREKDAKFIWSNPVTITVNQYMLRNLYTHQGPPVVTISKEIQSWEEIPFEVKRLMLNEGGRNIVFSDKEKELLSDEEKKLLKKNE